MSAASRQDKQIQSRIKQMGPKTMRLNLSNLQLTRLPKLPENIKALICDNNQLVSLPDLPDALEELSCSNNQLTSLPKLPTGLQILNVQGNQLSSLPQLPLGLTQLHCGRNQLSALPNLPIMLTSLYCEDNKIRSMPPIPPSMHFLYCQNNQLQKLPELPHTLYRFNFNNNPLIEPFKTLYNNYMTDYDEFLRPIRLILGIEKYYVTLRARGRNIGSLQRILKNKPTVGSEGPGALLGRFLSGKNAPTVEAQQDLLYTNVTGKNRTLTEANWYYGPEKGYERSLRVNAPLRISAANAAAGAPGTRKGGRRKSRFGRLTRRRL